MQDLNIALIQTSLYWEDKERNLEHFDALLQKINPETHLVVLPEMFSTGFSVFPDKLAEPMEGPTVSWLVSKASEKGFALAGSFIYGDGTGYYNRFCLAEPGGQLHFYDKRHLFRMAGEHHRFRAGRRLLTVEYRGWKIRPLICYDLRFPVWSKNNYDSGKYDYDLLIYIANWPEVRSSAWKALLHARAHENQCFVAAVNRVGTDGNGINHSGDSMVLNPRGEVLEDALPGQEKILEGTLKMNELNGFREKFTVGLDWDRFTIHDTLP